MIARFRRWNIKHLAILIALLAVGFGVVGVAGTVLLGIIVSPFLLAPRGRRRSGFYWVLVGYPLFLVLGLYGTWLTSWVVLGRVPRYLLDDPKQINYLEGPFDVTLLVLVTSPPAWVVGFIMTLLRTLDPSRLERNGLLQSFWLLLILLYYGAVFGLLRWDPFRVLEWFLD